MNNKLVSALKNCYFAFFSLRLMKKTKETVSGVGRLFKKELDVQKCGIMPTSQVHEVVFGVCFGFVF